MVIENYNIQNILDDSYFNLKLILGDKGAKGAPGPGPGDVGDTGNSEISNLVNSN